MNNRNSCCDIKLIHSAWKNGNSASTFFPSLSTLTLAQTLTQITGVGFVGGGGNLPLSIFKGGGNFPIMMTILWDAIFR